MHTLISIFLWVTAFVVVAYLLTKVLDLILGEDNDGLDEDQE